MGAWCVRLFVAVLFLASATGAAAQDAPDTTMVFPLQGVVVNVLRTPFEVTDAPFAVAANGLAEVQRARPGIGLSEALSGIPGVQVDDRFNYAMGDRISIRGFGARTPFGVRGVRVLVDGIPATLPDGTTNLNHVDQGFLRRVEVIRGPASSLYGNAAGGVIRMESEVPPNAPISQAFGIVYGSGLYDACPLDGGCATDRSGNMLRLNSTTGGRSGASHYLLNVSRLTFDGYRDLHEADNVQVNGTVGTRMAGGDLRLVGSLVDYTANNPGSLNATQLANDRFQAAPPNVTHGTGEDGTQGQLGASWQGGMGSGALELAAFGLMREIENPIPFNTIMIDRLGGGISALYRSTPGTVTSGFHWAVGAEGNIQSDHRLNYGHSPDGTRNTNPSIDQDERVLGGAAFLQVGAVPTPRLNVLAGLRYDLTQFEADVRVPSAGDSGDRSMGAISPSLGISYEVAPVLSLYGNVATSFETPTATELANQPGGLGGFNPELDPQRTVSFEAGAKGLQAGSFSYQVSAFHARIEDALIPFEENERTYFRNAGSAIHRGVEVGVTLSPLSGITTNLAYTFVDARFNEYVVDGESFEDNRIPGVSPHRLDGTIGYTSPFGLYATAEVRYSDRMPVNDRNTAFASSYALLNLRTGLQEVRLGRLAIEPFIGMTNVTDEEYIASPSVNHAAGRYYEPGPGRSIYLGGNLQVGGN